MLMTVLIIVLILMLVGAFPSWPHAANWGNAPFGLLSTVLVIVLVLWLVQRL